MNPALQSFHASHGATLEQVAGFAVASDYGDFPGEVAAIQEGAGVLVMEASGVLLMQGPDALTFFNGLTTNDPRALAVGGAQRTLLCANKGKILHDVVAVRFREDGLLVIAEPGEAEAVANHLEHYHVREDLQLGNVALTRVDVMGPLAETLLAGLGIVPGSVKGSFEGAALPAPRLPLGALPRLLLLPAPAVVAALAEALLQGSPQARLVGTDAQQEARIWAGVPWPGVDFGLDHLPAEASLYDRISFEKGCYVGQETHARMHYRGHANRKLVGLVIPEGLAGELAAGSAIFGRQGEVGVVTSLARLAREGERRAIAMVRYQELQPGARFAAQGGGPAQISYLPLSSDLGGFPR